MFISIKKQTKIKLTSAYRTMLKQLMSKTLMYLDWSPKASFDLWCDTLQKNMDWHLNIHYISRNHMAVTPENIKTIKKNAINQGEYFQNSHQVGTFFNYL